MGAGGERGIRHISSAAEELELLYRDRRATERCIRQAKFTAVKRLDSFGFLAILALNEKLVLELARFE